MLGSAPSSGALDALPGPTDGFGGRAEPWGWAITPRRCFALWSIFHPPSIIHLHKAEHNVLF